MNTPRFALALPVLALVGCTAPTESADADRALAAEDHLEDAAMVDPDTPAPPPAIQAWMDRLTVPHRYEPVTGFIVATETTALPALFSSGPRLDEAIRQAGSDRVVIAFATADRCAPCQQFKMDALRDDRVIARLGAGDLIATHVEVDREPELANTYLGGAAIPMSYALRDGAIVATLRGQRSAEDVLAWLDTIAEPAGG